MDRILRMQLYQHRFDGTNVLNMAGALATIQRVYRQTINEFDATDSVTPIKVVDGFGWHIRAP
jgi:hypothetical protein